MFGLHIAPSDFMCSLTLIIYCSISESLTLSDLVKTVMNGLNESVNILIKSLSESWIPTDASISKTTLWRLYNEESNIKEVGVTSWNWLNRFPWTSSIGLSKYHLLLHIRIQDSQQLCNSVKSFWKSVVFMFFLAFLRFLPLSSLKSGW
jgi:hypothetical protein